LDITNFKKQAYENEAGEIRMKIWGKLIFDIVRYLLKKVLGGKIYQKVSTSPDTEYI
jgi:hypothetical protein